jgi:hypothetical protein
VVAAVVKAHVEACRRIEALRYALAIIIPEVNMSFAAHDLQERLRDDYQLHNHMFMMQDSSGGKVSGRRCLDLPGSVTTERNKRESVELLIGYFEREDICFHESFVVVQSELGHVENVQLEMVKQLRNFKRELVEKKNSEGAVINQVIFTGKNTGERNDDFVATLWIKAYNKREFWRDRRYRAYWGNGEQ